MHVPGRTFLNRIILLCTVLLLPCAPSELQTGIVRLVLYAGVYALPTVSHVSMMEINNMRRVFFLHCRASTRHGRSTTGITCGIEN